MLPKDSYYSIKAVSNSSLKYIDPTDGGSPNKFKAFLEGNLKEDKASHFINGTLIHLAMLEPDRFVIADIMKPPAALGEIAEAMVLQNLDLDPDDLNILNSIRAYKWQDNYGDATVIKKFKDAKGPEYVEYMSNLRNTGKVGMDKSTGTTVMAAKASVEANPTLMYVLEDVVKDSPEIEAFNELEVQWTSKYKGTELKMKAKLDRLVIDHVAKTYWIIDVKTTGKTVGGFQQSFEEYKYPRQINFYKKAADRWLTQQGYDGYTCEKALIAVVETTGYHTSQLFDVTPYVEKHSPELKSLIDRVAFHYNSNNWIEPMESQMNDGVITLKPNEL